MPLDKLWLEATQLSLPLEEGLPTYLKVCFDPPLSLAEAEALLLPTGLASKLESIPDSPIAKRVRKSYISLSVGKMSIKLTQQQLSTSPYLMSIMNKDKSEKSKS